MAKDTGERGKRILLLVLGAFCAWVAYRNVFSPAERTASAPRAGARLPGASASSPARARQRGPNRNQQPWADMDPTLRVDLLESSRQVKYEGSSRNIFEPYQPPPPPAPPAVKAPPPAAPPPQFPAAPAVTIPLKFYGIAERPTGGPKKALLTDGEEIFIAQEGDLVARYYRIIRIGLNTIQLEDTRDHKSHQLPLLEE